MPANLSKWHEEHRVLGIVGWNVDNHDSSNVILTAVTDTHRDYGNLSAVEEETR
jgi:hypothetical protein